MQNLFKRIIPLAVVVFGSGTAHAYNLGMVEIHGFASATYLQSSGNNIIEDSEDGTFNFNDFGLNAGATFHDDIYVGFQVMSRDYGAVGNNDIYVNWALVDYQWRDALGFKIGKVKRPQGLYGDVRDYDFLRTSIMLPQNTIYNENEREYYESYTGGGLYGTFNLGKGGNLGYDIYYGINYDIDEDGGLARGMDSSRFQYVDGSIGYTFGTRLKWHTPVSGLLLALSYSQMEAEIDAKVNLSSLPIALDGFFDFPTLHAVVLSMEYAIGDLTVSAEYEHLQGDYIFDIDMSALGMPSSRTVGDLTGESYYLMLSYQFVDWFTAGVYYVENIPNTDDRDGDDLVAQGRPSFEAWQHDLAVTARFDLTDFWLIKLEYHYLDGMSLLTEADNPEGFEKSWDYFAVRTTLNF